MSNWVRTAEMRSRMSKSKLGKKSAKKHVKKCQSLEKELY